MGHHLSGHRPEDWAYGTRRYCGKCAGLDLDWALLADGLMHAPWREQRRLFGRALEQGHPSDRGVWWCRNCTGCGLVDAPALI